MAARNSSRTYLRRFLERAAGEVAPGARVLDAGAGRAQYRGLFAHAHYETADFLAVKGKKYARPDYVCDLAAIPVADARFDHVVCTQVLEHLPEPQRVIEELGRVLKPGGRLWLSAPLFYAEHERPYDFFRYTQFGLRQLLESARFEVLEIAWLEGYFGTLSYQVRVAGRALPAGRSAYGGGARAVALAGAARLARRAAPRVADVLAGLDERHKVVDAGLPKNHTVVARKPLGDDPHAGRVPSAPGG
jgi:SAM-dependent methyltransferase